MDNDQKIDNRLIEKETVDELSMQREEFENSWRSYMIALEARAEEIIDLHEFTRPETD